MTLPPGLGQNPQGLRAVLRQVHGVLTAIPGVQAVSLQGGSLPMQGDSELPFWKEGQPRPATQEEMTEALFYLVEPDYLTAMGTPLLKGRFFTEQENEHAPPVVVIDEVFAQKYYPNEDPIGKRINLAILNSQPEIIGVAGHVKHWGLDSDATASIRAQIYLPFMQIPDRLMPLVANGIGLVLRTQGPPTDVAAVIRTTLGKLNSNEVIYGVQTMDQIVSDSLAARKFSMILLGVFAALALVLSSIGISGVISYLVGQRTHEIGIRMALGAQQRDVLKLVLGQGMQMALVGVAIGLAAAIGLTRLMSKMLFQVTATDPITMVGVSALLIVVALAACYIPARRAMRTDPIVALRYE
jgi:predicted permease